MTIFHKVDGEWVTVDRPYIRRNGIQRHARKVFVKRSGTWKQSYEHDTTPSAVPIITLQIMDNRWIKVSARMPGASNDPDLKRIRILASREGPLGTQFGSGFINRVDDSHPMEPWSDWYYNNYGAGGSGRADSTNETFKRYPVNADGSTDLPGGKRYYFAAWSEDKNGNWSAANQVSINMPKKDPKFSRGRLVREARFQPQIAGSRNNNGTVFTDGELVVSNNPISNGFFYYGNHIGNAVGQRGTPTIMVAKLRLHRANDTGQPTANVRLFYHKNHWPETDVPPAERYGTIHLGTINKGETKWFDIPSDWFSEFNTQLKGFGLLYGNQASDYLVLPDLGIDMRNGELNVVWEEEL